MLIKADSSAMAEVSERYSYACDGVYTALQMTHATVLLASSKEVCCICSEY
jgi:hypothetical protein